MGVIFRVAVIIEMCLIIAVFESSLSYQTQLNDPLTMDVAHPTIAPDETSALEHAINHNDTTQIDALDFAIKFLEFDPNMSFKGNLIIGVAEWFKLRQDLGASKFKQVYASNIEEKCKQLRTIAIEQQNHIDDELAPLDHNKLKLDACEILLKKKVRSKVKSLVSNCKCKKKFKYRSGGFGIGALAICGVAACLGAAMIPDIK